MRPGDVPEGVDHHHDHEPEAERDADVAELPGLRVHHDRAAAGEDQCEGADQLGCQRAGERAIEHGHDYPAAASGGETCSNPAMRSSAPGASV